MISRGWYDVGRFLGPSIRGFYERWPLERQLELWQPGRDRGRARATHEPRRRRRDLGQSGGVRPAFYALPRGGWRDYVTLLHLPYTAWHLAYVVVGGCLAAEVSWGRLGLTVLAFFLAMGIGAHALDELAGRPLQTAIPSPVLVGLAVVSVAAACAIGVAVAVELQPLDPAPDRRRGVPRAGLQPRALRRPLPFGPLVRPRLGGVPGRHRLRRLRRDDPGRSRDRGGLGDRPLARPAAPLDPGPARATRRRRGDRTSCELADGDREAVTRETLVAAPEAALRLLAVATVLMAAALVALRL